MRFGNEKHFSFAVKASVPAESQAHGFIKSSNYQNFVRIVGEEEKYAALHIDNAPLRAWMQLC